MMDINFSLASNFRSIYRVDRFSSFLEVSSKKDWEEREKEYYDEWRELEWDIDEWRELEWDIERLHCKRKKLIMDSVRRWVDNKINDLFKRKEALEYSLDFPDDKDDEREKALWGLLEEIELSF